jgi:Flp pilus assembly protein TadG
MDHLKDDRGAVYIEFIVAIVPMLVLFWGLLQVNGLLLADLVVRNAAMNAVRAAIVCDSDEHTSGESGAQDCAKRAAQDTTGAVKSIQSGSVSVQIQGASSTGNAPVTATVSATYQCQVPLVAGLACGLFGGLGAATATATFQRSATLPNQGHYYQF